MDSLDDYQIPYGLMAEFDTPADVFCREGARCRLHTMGYAHAVPDTRNG